jgi:hypothetical protein
MPEFILRQLCRRPGLQAILWALSSQNVVADVLSTIAPHAIEFLRHAGSSFGVGVRQVATKYACEMRDSDQQRCSSALCSGPPTRGTLTTIVRGSGSRLRNSERFASGPAYHGASRKPKKKTPRQTGACDTALEFTIVWFQDPFGLISA